jgi:hypothetical protein
VAKILATLFSDPVKECPRDDIRPATSRDRLRSYAHQAGFVSADSSGQSDVDEFIRGDRVVHIRYGRDGRIVDILVNGECLFNRDRSVAAHRSDMAAYQRAGIGLVYTDDGHWIADDLDGDDKADAEARVNRAWASTHRHCPHSAQCVGNPKGRLTLYRCPECGQDVGLTAQGKVLPHSVELEQNSQK